MTDREFIAKTDEMYRSPQQHQSVTAMGDTARVARLRADELRPGHDVVDHYDDQARAVGRIVCRVDRTTFAVRVWFCGQTDPRWREYRHHALVEVVC